LSLFPISLLRGHNRFYVEQKSTSVHRTTVHGSLMHKAITVHSATVVGLIKSLCTSHYFLLSSHFHSSMEKFILKLSLYIQGFTQKITADWLPILHYTREVSGRNLSPELNNANLIGCAIWGVHFFRSDIGSWIRIPFNAWVFEFLCCAFTCM
jgi:hypothetical protein